MTLCKCGHVLAFHSFDGKMQDLTCDKCSCKEYRHVAGYATEDNKAIPLPKITQKQLEKVKEELKHQCSDCSSFVTAKRTNGKLRWHTTNENKAICHKCYEKIRKGKK
jgi:hypothetical protein